METTDNLRHAIPASSVRSTTTKSTITKKNAKKGLGAKKVGLGAHKVTKVDFEKLEKTAEALDNSKLDHKNENNKSEPVSTESLQLAYQDITTKERQIDAKMNKMDDRKKEQAQRLGMGMGRTDGVSHSLNMTTIDQVDVKPTRRGRYEDKNDTFYDAFFTSSKNWDSDYEDDFSRKKYSSSVDPIEKFPSGNTGMKAEPKSNRSVQSTINYDTKPLPSHLQNSKAISSDMLFGNQSEPTSGERLRKFDGATSISSEDYYGNSKPQQNHVPDVSDIKDGVKEGVRSVAGKLSNFASGIASSIQDRYG